MAKKKKQNKETTIEDFYDLKTEQMDELVAALKGETSEDDEEISYKVADCVGTEATEFGEEREYKGKSQKEFNPYKLDRLSRIPTWIKAFVVKYWFAGMVIYLVSFGLSSYITSQENIMLLTGLVMGIVVDFLINPLFRYFESSDKEYNPYTMFPFPLKKFWTIIANILYYIIVALGVNGIYLFIGTFIYDGIGVEPLFGGLCYFIVDMIFIGIKDLIVFLIKRAKNKKLEDNNV